MGNKRVTYTPAQNIFLVGQVNGICPLCAEPLFYKKRGKSYKNYEIAHIYPLNPTKEEINLLADEKRLSEDVNDEDNVIPLCDGCHTKFDKPRTVEEYRMLVGIKKRINNIHKQKNIWKQYKIEDEIAKIIDVLYTELDFDDKCEIIFKAKKVDEKLNDSMTNPTKRKIKNNVQDYYIIIRDKFASLDHEKPDLSEIISCQIKTYYLKQKIMGLNQQQIFDNIVSWIHEKTKAETLDSAEILTSFFVQNCEVFE
jgi:C-terminal domain 11 of the ABC-three component (ABC-3C) systems/HNH endonuclease